MEVDLLLIHSVIFGASAIWFYRRIVQTQRLRAAFPLYEVRDDLIYLVASGVVQESDPVFSFYYRRVNSLLQAAPNVGIDDMLQIVARDGGDLDKALGKAKAEMEAVLANRSAQKQEVRDVIERYYAGVRTMILTHSSLLRVLYVAARQVDLLRVLFENMMPRNNRLLNAFKITAFIDAEAGRLHRLAQPR